MYPAVPNKQKFYTQIHKDFEALYPDIQLTIDTDEVSKYYDAKGFITDTADVYEIDCVLIDNFIANKKIRPLNDLEKDLLDSKNLMPAGQIVYENKILYGIPHWLCSNFLFSRSNDSSLNSVRSYSDLQKAIGIRPAPNKSISIDLAGKLTLGEIYAGTVYDEYNDINVIKAHADSNHNDKTAVNDMITLCGLTNLKWSRSSDWHNSAIPLYSNQFVKNNARAFVGYSESLYDIFSYSKDSCSNCMMPKDIHIQKLVLDGNQKYGDAVKHIGWVDALAMILVPKEKS